MSVPLDEIVCTVYDDKTGREQQVPALHPRWRESVSFVVYRPPPLVPDPAEVGEFTERVRFIVDDLHWLLQLSHQHFWCQVIFDESVHRCIDSYLRYAPRSHDAVYNLPAEVRTLHDDLHRLVFMACLRMATHKESKEHFITPEEFGKIIYENYIFDIPKLMDLSVLYGAGSHGNRPLLTKMINNIFIQQPSYKEDLQAVVPTVLQVLQNISKQCGVDAGSSPSTPLKLAGTANTSNESLVAMEIGKFQDVVFYLSDTALTLLTFLQVYPAASRAFINEEFPIRLASVCEVLFPALTKALRSRDWTSYDLHNMLKHKVLTANLHLLKIYRQIVFEGCVQPILENSLPETAERHIEDYLQIVTDTLGERRFIAQLEHLFPFRDDRDILTQTQYLVDETRLQFIQDAVNEAVSIFGHREAPSRPSVVGEEAALENGAENETQRWPDDGGFSEAGITKAGAQDEALGACAPRVSGVELDSLIAAVKDLLPDVGEGFIELCLEEVNYDPEKVINMLLENNIPKSLQGYSRSMQRRKPVAPPDDESDDLLSQRKNVFDNDEFDVFSRDDVNLENIHKGKKEKLSDMSAVLDDKSSVSGLRPLYDKYGGEFVESAYDGGEARGEYDDEYDDTYDTNLIGATDADSMDELTIRRPFTVPRVLRGPDKDTYEEDTEEEGEEEDTSRKDHFLQDPAKIREQQAARRQQRQQQKQQHQRPKQQRPQQQQQQQQGSGGGERKYDVKGNPKGQGQSADVLKNRAFKEKNKASRVHHNRKNLADKKRKI